MNDIHTFAVCAWGESPYLEECIRSLQAQTAGSRIIMCTSTPCGFLSDMADRYGIPLYVRKGRPGIAADWNYAFSRAGGHLVTLAHQDDVYEPDYAEKMINAAEKADKPLILFSDYYELRDGEKVYADRNINLRIKRLLLFPLRFRPVWKLRFLRRRILSLGNAICCPSVTFAGGNLPERLFGSRFKADLDWQAWERISRLKGSFCYIPEPLMGHRIHSDSTTTKEIGENHRTEEDLEMFRKFWPEGMARLLNHFYSGSEKANRLE